MRVVFDTNILVSALITPNGNAATLLALAEQKKLAACYTPEIYAEYEEVIFRKKFVIPRAQKISFLYKITAQATLLSQPFGTTELDDGKDEIFYDAAKFYGLTLITGNIKDFPPASFIMTPAEFLRRFNERENRRADFSR